MIFSLTIVSVWILTAVVVHGFVRHGREQRTARALGCKSPKAQAPVRDPIIGLDFVWECLVAGPSSWERYLDVIYDAFRRHGPTYVVSRWSWTTVHTIDPRNVQHILATAFNDFELPRLRQAAMMPFFGRGIFTMNGTEWQHSRALLKPSFSMQKMRPLLSILEKHWQTLRGQLPADGAEVDLQPLFFAYTMDTATEFLMGTSANMLGGQGGGSRCDCCRYHPNPACSARFADDYLTCCLAAVHKMQLGPLQVLHRSWAAHQASRRLHAYVDHFVREALNSPAENSMVRDLAAATGDNRRLLRDQTMNVLLAGRDTTASLLSNLFFELARAPTIYQKLREEVLRSVKGDLPTDHELRDMEYLRWCINESLRLHPVVPNNARDAVRDSFLPYGGGPDGESPILVRKGTPVMYSVYAMHRSEATFGPDAEAFNPERWRGLRPGWAFLPFNGGQRICIGQRYALLEVSYLTTRLLQTFSQMDARDHRPWTALYTLSMSSKNGVQVSFPFQSPRQNEYKGRDN